MQALTIFYFIFQSPVRVKQKFTLIFSSELLFSLGHLNERIRDHAQNDRDWRRLGSGWRRKQDVPSKANKQQNLDFKRDEMKVVVDIKLKNNKNFVS